MLKSGHAKLWIADSGGRFQLVCDQPNTILTQAKGQDADLLRGHPQSSPLRAFAVGSDGTASSAGQTQLLAEVTRRPVPVPGTDTAQQKNIRTGSDVHIRQVFGPGFSFVLREWGLFGDLVELANPILAPVLTPSESGGLLTAAVYTVVYTWINLTGETAASPPAFAIITGSTGTIAVGLPTLPNTAVTARVFAAPSGPPLLSGTSTTTTYSITAFPVGAAPPAGNTALIPGGPNAGTMVNRVKIADHTILPATVFVAESVLVFS